MLAISTDAGPTLNHWKKELGADFPMLSDHNREISKLYGILIQEYGMANRVTFVVDVDGKITDIQESSDAIDPTHAAEACSRLKHKS